MNPINIKPELLLKAVEASNDGIVIVDLQQPDQPIIYANPAFETMTGYSHTQVIGRNCRFLQGKDTDQLAISELRAAMSRQHSCQVTLKNYTKSGQLFYNHLSISPVKDDQGQVHYYIGVQKDVSQEVALTENLTRINKLYGQMSEALTDEVQTDLLTGLNNRRYFDNAGKLLCTNAKRENWPLNIYHIAITDFIGITANFSESIGDVCLQSIADQIRAVFSRDSDICLHLKFANFVIITINHGTEEQKNRVASLENRINKLKIHDVVTNNTVPLKTNISVKTLQFEDLNDLDSLLTPYELKL